ncbi:hypothetical protein STENM327S_04934 [Streptomyces tendae]
MCHAGRAADGELLAALDTARAGRPAASTTRRPVRRASSRSPRCPCSPAWGRRRTGRHRRSTTRRTGDAHLRGGPGRGSVIAFTTVRRPAPDCPARVPHTRLGTRHPHWRASTPPDRPRSPRAAANRARNGYAGCPLGPTSRSRPQGAQREPRAERGYAGCPLGRTSRSRPRGPRREPRAERVCGVPSGADVPVPPSRGAGNRAQERVCGVPSGADVPVPPSRGAGNRARNGYAGCPLGPTSRSRLQGARATARQPATAHPHPTTHRPPSPRRTRRTRRPPPSPRRTRPADPRACRRLVPWPFARTSSGDRPRPTSPTTPARASCWRAAPPPTSPRVPDVLARLGPVGAPDDPSPCSRWRRRRGRRARTTARGTSVAAVPSRRSPGC